MNPTVLATKTIAKCAGSVDQSFAGDTASGSCVNMRRQQRTVAVSVALRLPSSGEHASKIDGKQL